MTSGSDDDQLPTWNELLLAAISDLAAAEARLSDAGDRLNSDRRPVDDELSNREEIAQAEVWLLIRSAKAAIDDAKNRLWGAQR
ncbi:hypothetical protein AB0F91_39735 [Amycolatopsis sp. NPDC023774]|uniref:hypothetical protein n=1 Tax=Amycolatopsis sp. NPDC023774 TaxID=3155015 RepID=UPI00340AB4CB